MMFYLQRLLLVVLVQFLLLNALELKINPFERTKKKIEIKLNSMRLGNYLRRLMLRNNDLIDKGFIFLDSEDFSLDNDDINYSNMQMEDNDNEFKARLFALKWAKQNYQKNKLKPYTVTEGNEELVDKWKSYLVLLMGDNGEHKLTKVCFPKRVEDNFALVTKFDKNCNKKIMRIKEYKILDNEDEKEQNMMKKVESHTKKSKKSEKSLINSLKTKKSIKNKKAKTSSKFKKYDSIISTLTGHKDKTYKKNLRSNNKQVNSSINTKSSSITNHKNNLNDHHDELDDDHHDQGNHKSQDKDNNNKYKDDNDKHYNEDMNTSDNHNSHYTDKTKDLEIEDLKY